MNKNNSVVNSWNEWDPLKHVIVGRADGTCIPAPEPALDAKVPEDSDISTEVTHHRNAKSFIERRIRGMRHN